MSMKFKKMIVIVNMLLIVIILTSCVGSRELDELGFVLSTAIDIEDEMIVLTHEVMIPEDSSSASSSGEPKAIYVQSTGETILEAIRNVTLEFDKKLFLAHNRVLIISDELARRGIGDFINFYIYDTEPRETEYIVVAKDAKAYEIIGISGGLSESPGRYLNDLIENHRFNSKTRSFTMGEYLKYFLEDLNPVVAVVEHMKKQEIGGEDEKSTTDVLNVEGGAAFHGDKLIGYYDGDEMKGLNFIVNEFENGLIVVEAPDELIDKTRLVTEGENFLTVEVNSSITDREIDLIDGRIQLTINVKIMGTLIENTGGLDLDTKDIFNAVELLCSNRVKEYIHMAMDKAQKEFKTDSFSIGRLVHIEYPDLWREISDDWDSIFPDISYSVNANVDIIKTGLLTKPVNIRK